MKIVKTMQGKEFLFDNKFSKNRIGPNDRKLDSFLRFKYKFVKFFHLKKLISKKAWYRCLEHHWESRNRKPNSFEKKRLSENIRLTSKDLTLKELVIYDLIPKEYLEDFKEKYLIFKTTFSNTSMFNRPQKDINDAFIKMASTRVSGSWYNLDHFGIKDSTALGGRFEYFRMEAIGLTESFFIIRYVLHVNENANKELEKILKANVYKEVVCISNDKWWKKKSFAGCQCFDLGGDAKCYVLEDYILELKALFWGLISKYIHSFFFTWENIPPSIEIYASETLEKKQEKILELLSSRHHGNSEYCEKHKTYFIPSVLSYEQKPLNNSKIIADAKQFESDHGLYNFLDIEETICKKIADYFLLEGLIKQASQLIYESQRKVNRNAYRKGRFNSLLDIKLDVEKQLYFYRRLFRELNSKKPSEDQIAYKFEKYSQFFTNPLGEKHPELASYYSFEHLYKGVFYNIEDKYGLMESVYSHFDENAKIIESRYNYRIVKWTFIVGVVSLLATILLAGDPCVLDQLCDFIIELFKTK